MKYQHGDKVPGKGVIVSSFETKFGKHYMIKKSDKADDNDAHEYVLDENDDFVERSAFDKKAEKVAKQRLKDGEPPANPDGTVPTHDPQLSPIPSDSKDPMARDAIVQTEPLVAHPNPSPEPDSSVNPGASDKSAAKTDRNLKKAM